MRCHANQVIDLSDDKHFIRKQYYVDSRNFERAEAVHS